MRRNLVAALAGALIAFVPGIATAQPLGLDLAFTTVAKASQGGHAQAEQRVITSAADYAAWFGGNPPASPSVDFASEDVLAVALGARPTSGYSVDITRVVKNTGVPGAVVHYSETKPTGIVLMVITAPVHVVKLAKGSVAQYSFVNDGAPAAAWDKLSAGTLDFRGQAATVELAPNGEARLLQSSPTAKYAPIAGQATAAELKAVRDAFAKADVATLPAAIVDPRIYVVAPTTVDLTSVVAGKTYSLHATLDYYPPYDARVKPLVDALRAIGARLLGGTTAPTFDRILLAVDGGFVLFHTAITVSKDGAVTVDRTAAHGGTSTFYTGQATDDELSTLRDAFAAADVATLPATIDDPTPIMDIPSQRIVSTIAGQDHTTIVTKAGRFMSYEPRLGPYVSAITAISNRLILEHDGQSITGKVSKNGYGALWVGGYAITGTSSLRGVIAAQAGKTVTIQAHVKRVGAVAQAEPMWVQGNTTANLNLRKSSSFYAKILTTLGKGDGVQITGVSKDGAWFKVDAAGRTGWVYRYYVKVGA